MKNNIILLVIMSLAPLWLHTARADEMIVATKVRPIVEWVETRTNVMLLPRPRIFISNTAMVRLASLSNGAGHNGEKIAAYRNGTVFISDRFWQPDNIADQSVLVHELVHYAQDLSGNSYDCLGQREAEAYRLQNEYLSEHDQRGIIDRGTVEAMERCH